MKTLALSNPNPAQLTLPRQTSGKLDTLGLPMLIGAVLLALCISATAGTGGTELNGIYDWFNGMLQGTGGRLAGIIALLAAIAVTAVTFKVAGVGGLLFIVIVAAFGSTFVSGMISAIV